MSPLEQFMVLEKQRVLQRAKLFGVMIATGILLLLLLGSFVVVSAPEACPQALDQSSIIDSLENQIAILQKREPQTITTTEIDTVYISDNEDVKKLSSRVKRRDARIKGMKKELSSLKKELQACTRSTDSDNIGWQEEIRRLTSELNRTKRQYDTCLKSKNPPRTFPQNCKREIDRLKREIESLKNKNDECERQKKQLTIRTEKRIEERVKVELDKYKGTFGGVFKDRGYKKKYEELRECIQICLPDTATRCKICLE